MDIHLHTRAHKYVVHCVSIDRSIGRIDGSFELAFLSSGRRSAWKIKYALRGFLGPSDFSFFSCGSMGQGAAAKI